MSTVLEGLGKDGTGHSIRSMSRSSHLINNLPNSTLISYSNLSIQQLMKCHTTCRKTTSSHLTQKLFRLCCLAKAEQSFQYSVVGHDICRPCTCHLAEVLYCPREILALGTAPVVWSLSKAAKAPLRSLARAQDRITGTT